MMLRIEIPIPALISIFINTREVIFNQLFDETGNMQNLILLILGESDKGDPFGTCY